VTNYAFSSFCFARIFFSEFEENGNMVGDIAGDMIIREEVAKIFLLEFTKVNLVIFPFSYLFLFSLFSVFIFLIWT